MLILFLYESGDHNLSVVDPQYPLFVLGGCIVESEYHERIMIPALVDYKKQLFGREDFILHTAEIARRRGIFQKLTNEAFREQFYESTNALMQTLDYQVIACVVEKEHHLRKYGLAAVDPYMLSLRILVERFVWEMKSRKVSEPGYIVAESRDETLDNQLRLAWIDLRTSGTPKCSATQIRKHVSELHIRNKRENIAGLQIADLIVSPIGRWVLGKQSKQDWEIIKGKLRKDKRGRFMGYGLVILPKKKRAAPE
ncbi:DUF3800 domain-containing protein [candidate division KSB1 bacterium]|nr:DUF3800 domain-containing protein [candidate division KSB1 bacterium]